MALLAALALGGAACTTASADAEYFGKVRAADRPGHALRHRLRAGVAGPAGRYRAAGCPHLRWRSSKGSPTTTRRPASRFLRSPSAGRPAAGQHGVHLPSARGEVVRRRTDHGPRLRLLHAARARAGARLATTPTWRTTSSNAQGYNEGGVVRARQCRPAAYVMDPATADRAARRPRRRAGRAKRSRRPCERRRPEQGVTCRCARRTSASTPSMPARSASACVSRFPSARAGRPTSSSGSVPRQAIERYGDAWTQPGNIVVSGAFTLERWRPYDRDRGGAQPDVLGCRSASGSSGSRSMRSKTRRR